MSEGQCEDGWDGFAGPGPKDLEAAVAHGAEPGLVVGGTLSPVEAVGGGVASVGVAGGYEDTLTEGYATEGYSGFVALPVGATVRGDSDV